MSTGKAEPRSAREWLDLVLDPGCDLLFEAVVGGDPLRFPGYEHQLAAARAATGCSESVLVADGAIGGERVVAIASEFAFLGGSMGAAAGERICRAFDLAARERRPVVALIASGGARMQEGMASLAMMTATVAARGRLAATHQPFIAYLREPTTGGVYASFASTADLILAQPRATIGFAGPRVATAMTGDPLPAGSHTAEWASAHDLVHAVVPPDALRGTIVALFEAMRARSDDRTERPDEPSPRAADAWDVVRTARDAARPLTSSYIGGTALMPLATGEIEAGGTRLGGRWVIAIGQMRRRLSPEGYRAARRAVTTAVRLRLPIVSFVDTPGADPSAASEAAGIAREIAATFDALVHAPVPTVACVTGEGGSGGALALAACDRLLVQENAFFSVIAPEGAAAILRRDDVPQVARDLRVGAHDLRALGIADLVVAEPPGGAAADPAGARVLVDRALAWAIADAEREGAPTRRRTDRGRDTGGTP